MNMTTEIGALSAQARDDQDVFLALAAQVRPRVEARLEDLLRTRRDRARGLANDVAVTLDAAAALAMRGGKRLRAVLVGAAYEACGGDAADEAVTLAGVGMELFQSYLLIHDDWMDESDQRRGGPSVHSSLRRRFASVKEGDVAAILAGDYLSALAQSLLSALPVPPARQVECSRVFSRMHEEVVLGQFLDTRPEPSTDVALIHDLKTGSYTVRGPLLLGAALAGASSDMQTAIERYARPLGLAFQLRDDLLGAFGDPRATGKPIGDDIRQGKRTLLIEELARDPAAAPLLTRAFGVPEAGESDVTGVIEALVSSGARRRAESRLEELLAEARRALIGAPLTPSGIRALSGAVHVLGERDR